MSDPTEKCAGYCHDWDTNWCDEVEDAEEPDLEEEEDLANLGNEDSSFNLEDYNKFKAQLVEEKKEEPRKRRKKRKER